MNLNYSNFLFLTSTYRGRISALCTTLSNVMNCVTGATFVVSWTDATEFNPAVAPQSDLHLPLFHLSLIASSTGNKIVHLASCGASVAQTKWDPRLQDYSFHYFINLDDDLLIPPLAWSSLLDGLALDDAVHTIGSIDANNSRGYTDYDAVRYSTVKAFLETGKGVGKIKVHWIEEQSRVHYHWISQLYCLPRRVWNDETIVQPILETFSVKGMRGYDVLLEKLLVERGHTIWLCTGVTALHFGMEAPYIGGNWDCANAVVQNVVNIEAGYVTRA